MSANGKGINILAETLRFALMILLVFAGVAWVKRNDWDLPISTVALAAFIAVYGSYFFYKVFKNRG